MTVNHLRKDHLFFGVDDGRRAQIAQHAFGIAQLRVAGGLAQAPFLHRLEQIPSPAPDRKKGVV